MRNRKGAGSGERSSATSTKELIPPPPIKLVSRWTVDEVGEWVEGIGLKELRDTIITHKITGDVLLDITESDLNYLNIHALGQRKKLLKQIKVLRDSDDPVDPMPEESTAVADDAHILDGNDVQDKLRRTGEHIKQLKRNLTPEQLEHFERQEQVERANAIHRLTPEQLQCLHEEGSLSAEQLQAVQKEQNVARERAFYYMCIQYFVTFVLFVILDQTFGKSVKGWLSGQKSIGDAKEQMADRMRMEQAAAQFSQASQRGPNGFSFP
jgi:hypothetical protein